MAECSVLSDGLASLAVDGLTARVRPQVQSRLGKTNDNTRENVTTQLPQPLPPKYPDVLTVSLNPRTRITGMWLTASNKLWVKYTPPGAYVDYLKLFNNDGKELGRWRGNVVPKELPLTCVDDALLSLRCWQWIKPSGESGHIGNAPNDWALCSKSFAPMYVLCRTYKLHRLDVISQDPFNVKLAVACSESLQLQSLAILPGGFDVSSCGTLICLTYRHRVDIYSIDNPTTITKVVSGDKFNVNLSSFCDNITELIFMDVFFFPQDGGDTLIAFIMCRGSMGRQIVTLLVGVFEIDHEDGFLVKRMVTDYTSGFDPATCPIHGPSGTLWLRCNGGNIVVREQ